MLKLLLPKISIKIKQTVNILGLKLRKHIVLCREGKQKKNKQQKGNKKPERPNKQASKKSKKANKQNQIQKLETKK